MRNWILKRFRGVAVEHFDRLFLLFQEQNQFINNALIMQEQKQAWQELKERRALGKRSN